MPSVIQKFEKLATDNAPGQEVRQNPVAFDSLLRSELLTGRPVAKREAENVRLKKLLAKRLQEENIELKKKLGM